MYVCVYVCISQGLIKISFCVYFPQPYVLVHTLRFEEVILDAAFEGFFLFPHSTVTIFSLYTAFQCYKDFFSINSFEE